MHIIKNAPRYDIVVLFATFFTTVFIDLVTAVCAGMTLTLIKPMTMRALARKR
jgi:MFS superfamily sulfate permease-like transporter